ncbi:hypothetical protein J4453_03335, partial [Candidatus Woesearchaeota archaeon]|nr:hypothetical protein [Candidatus Woesearchaeota archaeon]
IALRAYLRTAYKDKNGELKFADNRRTGDLHFIADKYYYTQKQKGKTKKSFYDWLREKACHPDKVDEALTKFKQPPLPKTEPLGQSIDRAVNGYIAYADNCIAQEKEARTLHVYLTTAYKDENGELKFAGRGKGGDLNFVVGRYATQKQKGKTKKSLYDWLKENTGNPDLVTRALELQALYARTRNHHSPDRLVATALSQLNIPTDARSLSELTSLFEGRVNDLVELLYTVRPREIQALEWRKIGRRELRSYLQQHLTSDSGQGSGAAVNGGGLPPLERVTSIIPFETYQREEVVQRQLLNMALNMYLSRTHQADARTYQIAIGAIDAQLQNSTENKVMQQVLQTAKMYIERMGQMSPGFTIIKA